MRILIADDHIMLREGLKQILLEDFPDAQISETGTTQQTLELLRKSVWDVLLLDIFMPGRGGLEVLQEARTNWPRLPVLVLSSAPEEQLAMRVLHAGAAGYINKQAASEQLIAAVKKVVSGGRYVSPTLAEKLAAEFAKPSEAPHEKLSHREFQILQLLVAGKPLKEIAFQLSLSPKTIGTFRTRLLEKLNLQNDVQLVRYALQHHLVE